MRPAEEKPLWKKLGWCAFLWAGGVMTVIATGFVLKFAMTGFS